MKAFADYIIIPEHRVVLSYGWSQINFECLLDHQYRLRNDPMFEASYGQVADFRDVVSVDLTTSQIRDLASHELYHPASPRAFVMSCGLQHGLGRMFQTYLEIKTGKGVNISIFHDMDSATRWIQLPAGDILAGFEELKKRHQAGQLRNLPN